MFGNLGAGEIILIVLVILLLFGAKKIPELAKGLGKGMSEFKKGLREVESDIKNADKEEKKKAGRHGKLAGMVIAVKDVLHLKDKPTTCSSNILRNYISLYTATAVQ